MLLLCCNLLSLPDGGSTTEWPGGFHLHHLCVIMRHVYALVMSAEGSPEGIPEGVERPLGRKHSAFGSLVPRKYRKWVKGLDPS